MPKKRFLGTYFHASAAKNALVPVYTPSRLFKQGKAPFRSLPQSFKFRPRRNRYARVLPAGERVRPDRTKGAMIRRIYLVKPQRLPAQMAVLLNKMNRETEIRQIKRGLHPRDAGAYNQYGLLGIGHGSPHPEMP
jgi:hypothetical protein